MAVAVAEVLPPLRGTALEVVNTVLVSFALTELLLRQRRLRDLCLPLAALGALNLLFSPRVHEFLLVIADVATPASANGEIEASAAPPPGATLVSGDDASPFALPAMARGLFRFLAVAAGFAAIAYVDVRRLRHNPYGPAAYAQELSAAVWLVLPVFPFLVMGFSCAFLIVAAMLAKLGVPEPLGEELIVYGQFYAPLSAIYWIIKKDWLTAERATPILPIVAAAAAAGHKAGGGGHKHPTD